MIKTFPLSLLTFFVLFAVAHAETCVECHREKTPAAVAQWEKSAHSGKVECSGCHGEDHEAIERGAARVTTVVCGKCHDKAFVEHTRSKHAQGLHSGWGCTRNLANRDARECRFCHEEGSTLPVTRVQCSRFLKQTSEMAEIGCNRCHRIETSCATCHSNHLTDLEIVRNPNVCAKCHMGPDHPQWEMWQTSQHGTINASVGGDYGPDCLTCHMSEGSHDVSLGITLTPAAKPYPAAEKEQRREQMLDICATCHARDFARRDLQQADAVLAQSKALVKEAEAIIWDLHDRSLLSPMPQDRPEHPLRGNALVTDGQMLYEDTSHIERLLFKMKKYDFAKTWKGAYHQNPAYTHWYGNAELKMDLVDIRSEALRLSKPDTAPEPQQEVTDIEAALEVLQRKFSRGAIDREAFERQKRQLLEQEFAPADQ